MGRRHLPISEGAATIALAICLTLLIAAFVSGALADTGAAATTWLPIAVCVTAAASCAIRAAANRDDRQAWGMFAFAITVWSLGALFEAGGYTDAATSAGSFADVCRVAFYPLMYLAMVQLIRGRVTRFASALWLDGLIGAAAVASVATGIVLPPALDGADGDLTALVLRLVLPLGDMLLLAFVAGVMALNGWRPGRGWIVLGVGFGLMAFAHGLHLSLDAGPSSGVIELLWPTGIALIGLAAWQPSALSSHIRMEGWGLLVAPTLFGWLTVALVAYGNFARLGALGLALAVLTLVLVMIRTGLTFRENIAIAEELRADVAESSRDALTGLPNHRAFYELLRRETSLARRHGRDLAVAVFDIDEFRVINQNRGHRTGDQVLVEVARRIGETLRGEDVLARLGGEEFAVLLPSTGREAAWRAAERARRTVEDAVFAEVGQVTVSAGVCDLDTAGDDIEMMRLADGALYWAKIHGRNLVYRYSPEVMDVLSADERAEQAERSRTLSALTALARAVDAKDATTQRHSERVATVASALAGRLGWPQDRRVKLYEAGLVHDVGKIGVPDGILRKTEPLSLDETLVMRSHATLGAQIVQDVLTPEQASWVRHHHERWDGMGYPDGLSGAAIPEGAQILAVADTWDAMTANRPYRAALAVRVVIDELTRGAGAQWCPKVVAAAVDLWSAGELMPSAAPGDPDERAASSDADTDPTWRQAAGAPVEVA